MKTYTQIRTPRTYDEVLAARLKALRGISRVAQTGGRTGLGAGTGAVEVEGTALAQMSIALLIATSGEPGDSTSEYQLSVDGGQSYAPATLIPIGGIVLTSGGVTFEFVPGPTGSGDSFVAGDVYTFDLAVPVFGPSAWQEFSAPRRLIELEAEAAADHEVAISSCAGGGLLRDSEGDWLDVLAEDVYGLPRTPAAFAEGTATLTCAAGGEAGTIDPGELVASDASGVRRFTNIDGGVLADSSTLLLHWRAEEAGAAWNLANGELSNLVTTLAGVSIANPARVEATIQAPAAPLVTVSGIPTGDFSIVVLITGAGAWTVGKFKTSTDGGATWSAEDTIGSGLFPITGTGLFVAFANSAYAVGQSYTCEASSSWLSAVGAEIESDESLRARCKARWATLAESDGKAENAIVSWAMTADPQVNRVLVTQDPSTPGNVLVYISTADGAALPATIAAVLAYVEQRIALCETVEVFSVAVKDVAIVGTIYVKAGKLAKAQAAAIAALVDLATSTQIGGQIILGAAGIVSLEILLSCLARGSSDNPIPTGDVVDLSISAPAADIVLAADEVPNFDLSALAWVEV